MSVNFLKTRRFSIGTLHVAYNEETLDLIRVTEAESSKEVILDDYDTQIMLEIILDHASE